MSDRLELSNITFPDGQTYYFEDEEARQAIDDRTQQIEGTVVHLNAEANTRYICGEVITLDLTPPASGICDVIFTSGNTPTVLSVPSTVKWTRGFDSTALAANTTYELNIMDGLGVAASWT